MPEEINFPVGGLAFDVSHFPAFVRVLSSSSIAFSHNFRSGDLRATENFGSSSVVISLGSERQL